MEEESLIQEARGQIISQFIQLEQTMDNLFMNYIFNEKFIGIGELIMKDTSFSKKMIFLKPLLDKMFPEEKIYSRMKRLSQLRNILAHHPYTELKRLPPDLNGNRDYEIVFTKDQFHQKSKKVSTGSVNNYLDEMKSISGKLSERIDILSKVMIGRGTASINIDDLKEF